MSKKIEKPAINPEECGHFGYILKGGKFVCIACGQPDPLRQSIQNHGGISYRIK